MADDASHADEQPTTGDEQTTPLTDLPDAGPSGNTLPLLSTLGRNPHDGKGTSWGLVSVLIIGATAMVIALAGLTIAIGRAPQQAAANPQSPLANTPTPTVQVTYESPAPTGTRWTPEPIITGVPQYQPSYDPTPTESESKKDKPSRPASTTSAPRPTVPPSTSQPDDGDDSDGDDDAEGERPEDWWPSDWWPPGEGRGNP
ncbi:MAG: hypothetical protein ACOX61_07075 [Brooklawnia sp.]|jgi:hypothetical protein